MACAERQKWTGPGDVLWLRDRVQCQGDTVFGTEVEDTRGETEDEAVTVGLPSEMYLDSMHLELHTWSGLEI